MFNYGMKVIDHVAGAATAPVLCDALRRCGGLMDSPLCNKPALLAGLKAALQERSTGCRSEAPRVKILGEYMPAISLLREEAAWISYSAFKIGLCSSVEQLKEQIGDILDLYRNKLTSPRTNLLSAQEIVQLLDIVQQKYQLVSVITKGRELEIYLLNKSHRLYNSWLLTYRDTAEGKLLNRWMLFSLSPNLDLPVCNKHFVFLHEIGHIFFHTLKETGGRAPAFFHEMSVLLGLPPTEDEDRQSEYFADLFAAACMKGTAFERCNPYTAVLSESMQELLELYFKLLASQVKELVFGFGENMAGHLH